jgi:hypothetical protein
MPARVAVLFALLAGAGCSKMAPEPTIPCWVNEDCPSDWYCEGAAVAASPRCVVAATGHCLAIADSMLGKACVDNSDCASSRLYCSVTFNDCEVNHCPLPEIDVVCNFGDCPDGGAGSDAGARDGGRDAEVIECRPDCRAGTSNLDGCRFCFCPSCP